MSAPPIDYEQPVPWPLGEQPADDPRDGGYRMESFLSDWQALPAWRYYGIYDSKAGDLNDTPLDQSRCHAYQDRTQRDPLGCGHCVGFSDKHFLLAYPLLNRSLAHTGSDIYHLAQREFDEWDGHDYQGTSVRAGMKALASLGYIGAYVWASDTATVRHWLLSGRGPVCIGTTWTWEMFYPERYGGYLVPNGGSAGGHAWLLDGYSTARGAFRMLNSWSGSWGVNGRAWIKEADLAALMSERANAAVSPVEIRR